MSIAVSSKIPEIPERDLIRPQAGGQVRFFESPAFEVLGGGAAGGGKSWALVVLALGLDADGNHYYTRPGYRAVLFRRESTQLAKLLDEAKRYYPRIGGIYTAQRRGDPGPCFEFPTSDALMPAKIYFCHMENEDDKENHQGHEYQFVGFDELTQFTLTQYLYLFSRVRQSLDVTIQPRIRSTTNPTGSGLVWVKKRFISGLTPNQINYFLADRDPSVNPQGLKVKRGTRFALSREFIPMTLEENTILRNTDPTYAQRIMQLGHQMSQALLMGDWDAFGGDFFKMFDYSKEVIDPIVIPREWRLIGSLDPGYSSPCSFGLTAVDLVGNVYRIATYYERERSPEQHAAGIKMFIKANPWTRGRWPDLIVSDPSAFAKRDRFAVLAHGKTYADVMAEFGILCQPGINDRVQGWWMMKNLMPNRYFVFRDANKALLEELTGTVADDKHPEDIDGCGNDPEVADHALDEQRYAIMAMPHLTPHKEKRKTWEYTWGQKPLAEMDTWKPGMG